MLTLRCILKLQLNRSSLFFVESRGAELTPFFYALNTGPIGAENWDRLKGPIFMVPNPVGNQQPRVHHRNSVNVSNPDLTGSPRAA